MAKLPKPTLFSFEYVVQNVMMDPEDEQTVHWMGLESSEEAAWRQEQNGGATAFQESKELRLRYSDRRFLKELEFEIWSIGCVCV